MTPQGQPVQRGPEQAHTDEHRADPEQQRPRDPRVGYKIHSIIYLPSTINRFNMISLYN